MFGHVVYETHQKEREVSAPLMLKNMISRPFCQDFIRVQYFNEIFFYTRAFPLLQQFGNLQKLLPTFYNSYVHCGSQSTEITLIYEDLVAQGFRDHTRFSFIDLEHLTLMLHRLGQFHSYSYIAKSRNPREFRALGNWFKYASGELIREQPNLFRMFSQVGLHSLRLDARYSSHVTRVEKLLENADALILQWNSMEQDKPMSVLCHGDYLRGNVMFRYENGQPVDMKMIDMATCGIASPVIDLSLVLYLNADQQTRNQHWNQLIDAYYEGLCQVFGGTGVPSKESILKEFTTKAVYGYFIATHFLTTLIELDLGLPHSFDDCVPTEFHNCSMNQVPENVYNDSIKKWCNNSARTEALADILRDLIDRNCI